MTEEVDKFYYVEYAPCDDRRFVPAGSRHYKLVDALEYVNDAFSEDYPKSWRIIKRVMHDVVVKEKGQ
jgi:hypothetical protein